MLSKTVFVTDYTIADVMDLEQEVLNEVDAQIVRAQCTTEDEVLDQIGDPDAIITQWAPVTRKVLSGLTNCKVICRNGIGVDNIDLAAAKDLAIAVTNCPSYCIPEVADHALSLSLALLRRLQPVVDAVRSGCWDVNDQIGPIRRLSELTFGIVGLGRIGRAVAARALPFFGRVIGFDPYLTADARASLGFDAVSRDELFSQADIITLHCPLNDETRHLVCAETLGLMKPTAYIVNTCRGGVVSTHDLVAALSAGKLAGAGLDVHDPEPLPDDHPLRRFPSVIITPHVAYFSQESAMEARRQTAQNIALFLAGKDPISRLV